MGNEKLSILTRESLNPFRISKLISSRRHVRSFPYRGDRSAIDAFPISRKRDGFRVASPRRRKTLSYRRKERLPRLFHRYHREMTDVYHRASLCRLSSLPRFLLVTSVSLTDCASPTIFSILNKGARDGFAVIDRYRYR